MKTNNLCNRDFHSRPFTHWGAWKHRGSKSLGAFLDIGITEHLFCIARVLTDLRTQVRTPLSEPKNHILILNIK